MAAPEVRAVGTVASGEGEIAPGLPAGTEAGDLLVMPVESQGAQARPTVAGWTYESGPSGVQGNTRLTYYYKVAVSSDATTVSDSGDHQLARIIGIKKGTFNATTPFPQNVFSTQTSTTAVSIPGVTTTIGESLILAFASGHLPDAEGSAEFSGVANASLTGLTELINNTTSAGDGGAIFTASGVKTVAGAVSSTTVTAATAAERVVGILVVAPIAAGAATQRMALTGVGA